MDDKITGAMARIALCALVVVCTRAAWAQEMVTDAAPFRTPIAFVTPKAPVASLAQHGRRRYAVTVAIDEQGRMVGIRTVAPDDADFRRNVEEVAKYWVFYPQVDPEACRTVPSQARIELEYQPEGTEPRVWLVFEPMDQLVRSAALRLVKKPPTFRYPEQEQYREIEGRVYVLMEVAQDGSVTDSRLLLGLPPSPGFVRKSLASALEARFEPGTAAKRCTAFEYIFRLQ